MARTAADGGPYIRGMPRLCHGRRRMDGFARDTAELTSTGGQRRASSTRLAMACFCTWHRDLSCMGAPGQQGRAMCEWHDIMSQDMSMCLDGRERNEGKTAHHHQT